MTEGHSLSRTAQWLAGMALLALLVGRFETRGAADQGVPLRKSPVATAAGPTFADDAFEPDNTPAQAGEIQVDGPAQDRGFGVPADADWARFTLASPGRVTIETDGPLDEGDTIIWLFGPGTGGDPGPLLAFNDDGGRVLYSRIVTPLLGAGTYFVLAGNFNRAGTLESYTLRVAAGLPPPPAPDPFEPDDTRRQAQPIEVGAAPQIHSMHVPGDVDVVRFRLRRFGRVSISTTYAGDESAATELRLYRNNIRLKTVRGTFASLVMGLTGGAYTVEVRSLSPNGTIEAYGLLVTTL